MGYSVHAKGQLLLRILVELLPQRKCLCNHLALLYPFGFIVTAANDPGERNNRRDTTADNCRYAECSGIR